MIIQFFRLLSIWAQPKHIQSVKRQLKCGKDRKTNRNIVNLKVTITSVTILLSQYSLTQNKSPSTQFLVFALRIKITTNNAFF